jgi:asparagine N-glycosylation enzyme membrane subunit Stt3
MIEIRWLLFGLKLLFNPVGILLDVALTYILHYTLGVNSSTEARLIWVPVLIGLLVLVLRVRRQPPY